MMPEIFGGLRPRSSVGRCYGSFQPAYMPLRRKALLSPDFKDILSAFVGKDVEFLVVGGYAVAFHGFVRGTGDFDIWIRASDLNAERTWNALIEFGAPLSDLTPEDLKTPGIVFQMGVPPNRIDIINKIDGVEFDDAWPERKFIEFEGILIPIIGKPDLLKNKQTMNRPKDIADILWLTKEE